MKKNTSVPRQALVAAIAAVLTAALSVQAQSPQLPKPPSVVVPKVIDSSMASMTNPSIRTISPNVLEMGSVRIDKQLRSVTFPVKLNMSKGLMEYFLVTDYGKTHESVLRTEVAPYNIHVAMLLLGARAETNQLTTAPQSTIANPSKTVLPGDKISIMVSWTLGGKEIHRPAEELVLSREGNSAMKPGGWVYNGSAIWGGAFLAQREGSIASLVTDPSALINYTGPGHDNDHNWTLDTNNLPPFDLPLQVTVQLEHK